MRCVLYFPFGTDIERLRPLPQVFNGQDYDFMDALRAYLRLSVMPPPRPLEFLQPAIGAFETLAAEGSSFPAIFGLALNLGCLSSRQVYHEALQARRYLL